MGYSAAPLGLVACGVSFARVALRFTPAYSLSSPSGTYGTPSRAVVGLSFFLFHFSFHLSPFTFYLSNPHPDPCGATPLLESGRAVAGVVAIERKPLRGMDDGCDDGCMLLKENPYGVTAFHLSNPHPGPCGATPLPERGRAVAGDVAIERKPLMGYG